MSKMTFRISVPKLKALSFLAGMLALGMFSSTSLTSESVQALEVNEKHRVFDHAPRLIRSAASEIAPTASSTYHFTIQVPAAAGEALRAVRITQQANLEKIDFVVERTSAFQGSSFAGGPSLSLTSIGGPTADSNEVIVEFEQPVQPGETVTVALKANKNPRLGGVYQFGIEAFPSGEHSPGLYLGSAYLRFNLSN